MWYVWLSENFCKCIKCGMFGYSGDFCKRGLSVTVWKEKDNNKVSVI